MAEVAGVVRLGQEVIPFPGAVSGILVNVILAVVPSLGGIHPILQPLMIGPHVDH